MKKTDDKALSEDQANALDFLIPIIKKRSVKEAVLGGSAGCGKSYLLSHLLPYLDNACFTATTHKAAGVLSSFINRPVSTIHSLLGLKPSKARQGKQFKQNSRKIDEIPWRAVVVVDEASMVGTELLGYIRKATAQRKLTVLYIGDPYQLLPVGEDEDVTIPPVFKEVEKQALLKTVHRQAEGSNILRLATSYRDAVETGVLPTLKDYGGEDVTLLNNFSDFRDWVKYGAQVTEKAQDYSICQTLAYRNNMVRGHNSLGKQAALGRTTIEVGDTLVAKEAILDKDDAVVVNTNEAVEVQDTQLYTNGWDEAGTLVRVKDSPFFVPDNWNRVNSRSKALYQEAMRSKKTLDWSRWRKFNNAFTDLRPPYASTLHNSQGSTYRAAFLNARDALTSGAYKDVTLLARLLYVGSSRPSTHLYIYH